MFINVIITKLITMHKRNEMLKKNESRVFDAENLTFEEMVTLFA